MKNKKNEKFFGEIKQMAIAPVATAAEPICHDANLCAYF